MDNSQLTAPEDKTNTAQMLAGMTNGSAAGGSNAGGYSIPNIGMLTAGVTGSAILGRQLRSAGIGLAGSLTSGLAGGLVGAVAKGLGPQGTTLLGLAASAIANPSQALRTVENMALSIVMGIGVNYLNQGVTSLVQGTSNSITGFVRDNIGNPLSNAYGEAKLWIDQQTYSYIDSGSIPDRYLGDPALQMLQNAKDGNFATAITWDNSSPLPD